MNSLDKFFSTHKVIFVVFIIITLPLVIVWFLAYGVIIGIVGITVDRWETVRKFIRMDVIGLLKYPKWKNEAWKEGCLRNADTAEERREIERAFAEKRRKVPGTIGLILKNVIFFGICPYPILLIWGIITGPIRAFIEYWKWGYKIWYGYSVYKGG